jgi:oxaloacetate decarboxylase alpha subunit
VREDQGSAATGPAEGGRRAECTPCTRRATSVAFADTTLRDGQMSLWHSSMRTAMMLPVAPWLDRAGFVSAEVLGPSFFKKCVRDLRDDPLERVRLLARLMPHTPLRAVTGRSAAAFQLTPPEVARLWHERVAAAGIRVGRASDPSNTVSQLARRIAECREAGMACVVNLIYSVSPKHTDAYYEERARQVAALAPSAICIKDPGGLLTPERTRTLVPLVRAAVGTLPLEFHTHCTTGLGPLCCLDAVALGADIVDACVPPLADGSSNPPVTTLARNLRTLGHEPQVDCDALEPVTAHLTAVAAREGLPLGRPVEYDAAYYEHQIPGGMASNLRHQLSMLGMSHRLPEVLAEAARVRADFGFPVMVTPYSQFVGVQASVNVILGERYREVTDEVIGYALGLWGDEECRSIDPDVRDRILARPRARALAGWQPAQPSRDDLRRELGGPGVSDDEVLLRYMAGTDQVEALRAAPATGRGPGAHEPLVTLIRELCGRRAVRSVYVERGDLRLHLAGRAPQSARAGAATGGAAGTGASGAGAATAEAATAAAVRPTSPAPPRP